MQGFWDLVVRFLRRPWSAFFISAGPGGGSGVPSSVQATIAQLRYWAPTIADVAHVTESEEVGGWRFVIAPRTAGACPVAVTLRETGRFDITVAGETYRDRALDVLDLLLPLLERIAEGRIVQRRWVSLATGAPLSVETIVSLGPGRVWHEGPPAPEGGAECHDHHFLPYRRA